MTGMGDSVTPVIFSLFPHPGLLVRNPGQPDADTSAGVAPGAPE